MEGTLFSPAVEGIKHVKSEHGELMTKPFLEVCKLVLPILGSNFFLYNRSWILLENWCNAWIPWRCIFEFLYTVIIISCVTNRVHLLHWCQINLELLWLWLNLISAEIYLWVSHFFCLNITSFATCAADFMCSSITRNSCIWKAL